MAKTSPTDKRFFSKAIIGKGGMGVVYCAFDSQKGCDVAIKRLLPTKSHREQARLDATARLEREFYTLAQLVHPSIIKVYDYGIDRDGPFYTMEYLEGDSLRDQSPLPWIQACKLLRDISSSLAVIHSRRLIHRDVTTRNIHRTPDGRAKLIDFDAMTTMGVAKHVVGTPPYLAPEVIHQQALDARTDLYGLGATLYYVLVGRHAYPARDYRQLYDLWRSPIAEPSALNPDVPKALEQLIFTLLSLSPGGRPGSAAEVFERLTAIADLPADENIAVVNAYLNTPTLVGRADELTAVRKFALGILKGGAQSVFVKSEAGVGRSRFLDAIVLEAKLLGFEVLRADASDSIGKPFGVARRLFDELLSKDSRTTENEKTDRVLRYFAGGGRLSSIKAYLRQERAIADCCELFDDASKNTGLAIVVDDIHLIDRFSLALLATLCTKNRAKKMLLALSIERDEAIESRSAIELISQVAHTVVLRNLTQEDCSVLLTSMFGTIPNLNVLSTLMYRTCGGNPRNIVDAAQTLVDEKLLRYGGGNWLLRSDTATLEKRLERFVNEINSLRPVSGDALELLALVAIDRDCLIDDNHYIDLTEHRNPSRFHRAMDELLQNGQLQSVGNRFRLVRQAEERLVIKSIGIDCRRSLHLRIAERLSAENRNPIYQTYHFLHAGVFERAIGAMKAFAILYVQDPESDVGRKTIVADTIEELLRQAEQRGYRSPELEYHRSGLVLNAAYNASPERAVPHLDRSIRSMVDYSGLADYAALTHLDASERLAKSIELAQIRCRQDGSDETFFNVVKATQRIAQLSIVAASFAYKLANPGLLLFIPDLTPLRSLSPVIGLVIKITTALTKLVRGRQWDAWDDLKAIQQELKTIGPNQLDELSRLALEAVVLSNRCIIEVEYATPETLETIREHERLMPVIAHSLLASYYASVGDKSMAELKHQEFEIAAVQTAQGREVYEFELLTSMSIDALSNDLLGLKRTLSAIEELIAIRPLWKYRRALVEAHYLRCRGQIDRAIAVIEKSLLSVDHYHCDWWRSAAVYVELLTVAGRYEESRRLSEFYLVRATELRVPTISFELTLAISLSKLGATKEAETHFEYALSTVYDRQIQGINLARCLEVGGRIAIDSGDSRAFNHYASLWSARFRRSSNPALVAQFNAMVREADERGIEIAPALYDGLKTSRVIEVDTELRDRLRSSIQTSANSEELYSYVVALLLERSRSTAGLLYLNTSSGIQRVFATLDMPSFDALDRQVCERYQAMTTSSDETTTVTGSERSVITAEPSDRLLISIDESDFVPFLLECYRSKRLFSCGIALLVLDKGRDFPNRTKTIAAIADVLADCEGVVKTRLF